MPKPKVGCAVIEIDLREFFLIKKSNVGRKRTRVRKKATNIYHLAKINSESSTFTSLKFS